MIQIAYHKKALQANIYEKILWCSKGIVKFWSYKEINFFLQKIYFNQN